MSRSELRAAAGAAGAQGGTFRPRRTFGYRLYRLLAAGDFDGDGDPDLAGIASLDANSSMFGISRNQRGDSLSCPRFLPCE